MHEIETAEYVLPAYWASYLINGDASGLEDDEQAEIDQWLDRGQPGCCVDCGESEFSWRNDATGLCGDVATFVFHKL